MKKLISLILILSFIVVSIFSVYAFNGVDGDDFVLIAPKNGTCLTRKDIIPYKNCPKIRIAICVTKIDTYAFGEFSNLKEVVIPFGVTEIGSSAFSGCSNLRSINIPDSVVKIGSSAFSGCSGLRRVIIPKSVTEIGWAAFQYCSGLKRVAILNDSTDIFSCVFWKCLSLGTIQTNINIDDEIKSKLNIPKDCKIERINQ